MKTNNNDEKYQDVIKILKAMPHIEAPENFDAALMRKINRKKPDGGDEKSFLLNLLMPSRLIPSAAVLASALIIFLLINTNSSEASDPFLIEPKLREDVYEISANDEVLNLSGQHELTKEQRIESESPPVPKKSDNSPQTESKTESLRKNTNTESLSDEKPTATVFSDTLTDYRTKSTELSTRVTSRQGLNYKIVYMSEQEKRELRQLKEKLIKKAKSEDIR
ncbi:MAG: hypothetical protein Kow0098_07410 [Ignavibacteriaceae bacterium]